MEHREDVEIHIVMCHIMDNGVECIPHDHAVRYLGSFRQTSCSTGEDQRRDIFRFERFACDWNLAPD